MNTLKETLRGSIRTIYGAELGFSAIVILPAAIGVAGVVAGVLMVKFKRPALFAIPVGLAAGIGATAAYFRIQRARAVANNKARLEAAPAPNSRTTTVTLGTLAEAARN